MRFRDIDGLATSTLPHGCLEYTIFFQFLDIEVALRATVQKELSVKEGLLSDDASNDEDQK